MGFANNNVYYDYYYPTDTQLAINDSIADTTSTSYVKALELTLIKTIYPDSRFRFKFSIATTTNPILSYGKIYKNGVAVGTEQTNANLAYSEKTEDIDIGNWNVDDTIELWIKTAGGIAHAKGKDLKICGDPSDWVETYP